ncbi:UDP-N-acetylmuramoyl-tripeptide--D-alanyl-D-alanine ligase [Weissella soli]|uniref:UDP-N-acetylmuramoyl-tripeptide--D-alanyl-D- alanine ligase n=1 Tax=Weissella soli TaxID=155866 RepID=UPI003C70EA87
MHYTVNEIAAILTAEVLNATDAMITNVVFDGRKATEGSLFIPLVATNDGHNYVQGAIDNGTVATLWQIDHRQSAPSAIPVILVENTEHAFQALAAAYLQQVHPRVVAISGSNGKTTTKDFTAAIGATTYKTVKTPANFNNEIGVPTTILAMPEDTELLVVEFGMDHPGDLSLLSGLYHPDITLLTMIGEAHIEFFKTRARIADGKMEIINGMNPAGTFVYNGDEPLLRERAAQHPELKMTTFGLNPDNDLYANHIELTPVKATFLTNQSRHRFEIALTGRYNVANALAAIQVGRLLAIPFDKIAVGLAQAALTENRTEWLPGNFGGRILSDVYNSNPTAAKEVLTFFAAAPTKGRRIAVLGDMLELGEAGPALHAALAEVLNPTTIQKVYLVGSIIESLEQALKDSYPAGAVSRFDKDAKAALTTVLENELTADDIILFKGSHGIHLEDIVTKLRQ